MDEDKGSKEALYGREGNHWVVCVCICVWGGEVGEVVVRERELRM